jgi:hypothetical protein
MRSEVLIEVTMQNTVLWDVTPCGHMQKYTNILVEPTACIFRVKEENRRFLWTVNFYQNAWYHIPESHILYRITHLYVQDNQHSSGIILPVWKSTKYWYKIDKIWGFCGDEDSAFLCYNMLWYQQVSIYHNTCYHNAKCLSLKFHHCEGLDVIKVTSKARQPSQNSLTRNPLYEDVSMSLLRVSLPRIRQSWTKIVSNVSFYASFHLVFQLHFL